MGQIEPMAFSQADLTAVEQAISTGALEVQYTDKRVRYRAQKDLFQLRDLMRRELGLDKKSNRKKTAVVDKGL